MSTTSSQTDRSLPIWWVIATIVGWAIGFWVCEAIKPFLYDITHLGGDGLVIGASIGITQGILVSRHRIASFGAWLVISSIGFGLGKFIGEAVTAGLPATVSHVLTGAVIGASIGVAQWLLLRTPGLSRTGWWLVANMAGWAVAWSLISLAEDSETWSMPMVYLLGGLGAGVAGILTGMALGRMSQPQPAQ